MKYLVNIAFISFLSSLMFVAFEPKLAYFIITMLIIFSAILKVNIKN